MEKGYIRCAWRLQNCNRSPLSALPSSSSRPLRWRCGPALRHIFHPSAAEAMCRRLGAARTAGRPSTTVPCGDACAPMPASPTAAPLTLRASRHSFLSTHRKHEKRAGAVSDGQAASGPTSPRSRCPAPCPPGPGRPRVARQSHYFRPIRKGAQKTGRKTVQIGPAGQSVCRGK